MTKLEVEFILEAIDHRWAYKFRNKEGHEFWLIRDAYDCPEGVCFTPQELAELQATLDPDVFAATIKAKIFLGGSKLVRSPQANEKAPKTGELMNGRGMTAPPPSKTIGEALNASKTSLDNLWGD